MRTTLTAGAATLFAAALLSAPAAAQCPVGGLNTFEFGTPVGFFGGPALSAQLETTTCTLELAVDAPACCNTYVTGVFFALGATGVAPVDLGAPFLPGSQLHVSPDVIVLRQDPLLALGLPNDPNLVGMSFFAQAAPIYFTTIGLTTDLGVTEAVAATFQ